MQMKEEFTRKEVGTVAGYLKALENQGYVSRKG
jgi:hypothetical protein